MMQAQIPKGVRIVVRNGINLEYCVPGSKKSGKSWNWCVVFVGGKKKMTTDYVESKDGCPTWNCEVAIDLVSAADPVVMMVLDGDHRHIGQVIVPLCQIRYTDSNNFDPSRLVVADLEPTKKNSTPRGRLAFWIWATSFWPAGTKVEHRSKSIKGSLSHLGGKLRSKHNKHREPDDQSSTFSHASDATRSSRAPSMVSGAYSESNLSANTSFMGAPDPAAAGGWPGSGAMTPHYQSQLTVPGASGASASYNPMAGLDDGHGSDVDEPRVASRPPIYQSAMLLSSNQQTGYAESTSGRSGKSNSLLRKMKSKLSKSTHNLTRSAAKKAGGDKVYGGDGRGSVLSVSSSKINQQYPDSTSFGINRIPSGSVLSLSRENYPIEGGTRSSAGDQAYSVGGGGGGGGGSMSTLQQPNSPYMNRNSETYGLSRPDGAIDDSMGKLPGSQASGIDTGGWGLHAEERPKKRLEDMSKREVIDYAMQMEKDAQIARAELTRSQTDMAALSKKLAICEEDLESTRKSLADLKFRLMDAGMLSFLELPASPERAYSLQISTNDQFGDMNGYGHAASVGGFASTAAMGTNSANESGGTQSILDRIQSFAQSAKKPAASIGGGGSASVFGGGGGGGGGGISNPFGSSATTGATSEPTAWW